jgi:DNA-binding IclR family transcriptional regulator
VCAGELESSLYGVSAPVLDRSRHPLAVLSIWGPQDRVTQEKFAELGAVAIRAAAEISSAPSGEQSVN